MYLVLYFRWLWGGERNTSVVGVSFKVNQPSTVSTSSSSNMLSNSNSASGNNISGHSSGNNGPSVVSISGSSGNVGNLGTISEVAVPTSTEEAVAAANVPAQLI